MKHWYVLNTKPKKEFQVEKLFLTGGIEVYNPKYIRDGGVHPFFAGYEFIKFEFPDEYRLVRYTRGVKRVVGNREGPIRIQDEVIEQLKSREVDGHIELEKYGREPDLGDEIEVMEGPLKGLRGIFKKDITDKDRVIILLNYVNYQGQLIIEKKKLKKVL